MTENLIHHRLDTGGFQNIFQILLQEIGDTDSFHFSALVRLFQRPPDFPVFLFVTVFRLVHFRPRLGRMDNHQIQIRKPHFFQRSVNGLHGRFIAFTLCRHFRGDKNFLPSETAGKKTFPDTPFISVRLGGIDMAVPNFHRRPYRLSGLAVFNKPGSQSQLGNLFSVMQR